MRLAKPGEVAREAIRLGLSEGAGRKPPDASDASVTAVHSASCRCDAQARSAGHQPGAQRTPHTCSKISN